MAPAERLSDPQFLRRHWLWAWLSSPSAQLVLFLATAFTQALILRIMGPEGGDKLFQLQTQGADPCEFKRLIAQWSDTEIQAFQEHFVIDRWLHPVNYGLFFMSLMAGALRTLGWDRRADGGPGLRWSLVVPALILGAGPAVLDVVENHLHCQLLPDPRKASLCPGMDDLTVRVAGLAALGKWLGLLVSLLLLGPVFLYRLRRLCAKRSAAAAAGEATKRQSTQQQQLPQQQQQSRQADDEQQLRLRRSRRA